MAEGSYDVIVVGGGVSGLNAANTIKENLPNATVLILEANDRLGGRLCTSNLRGPDGATDDFDLGGHWVSRTQPHALQLVKELDLETEWQNFVGSRVTTVGESKRRQHGSWIGGVSYLAAFDIRFATQKIDKFLELVPAYDFRECPYAKAWDSATLETFKENTVMTKEGKAVFDAMTSFFGAVPSQMSLLYFLHYLQISGGLSGHDSSMPGHATEMAVKGGTYQIITKLALKIGFDNIKLNSPVMSVSQDKRDVKVATMDGREFKCKFVIISAPVHCKAKLKYSPPLPRDQAAFLERMPMSQSIKFAVTYETQFWKNKGLSGANTHFRTGESEDWFVLVTFDASTESVPALVGFINNELGRKFSLMPESKQKEAIIKSLVRFLGKEAENVIDLVIKDWSTEPYVGGLVGVASPGTYTLLDEENLRRPVGRIHWAGTETATLWRGYIDGAIQSGLRAAFEVLTLLKDGFIVPTLYSVNDIKMKGLKKEESFFSSFKRKGR